MICTCIHVDLQHDMYVHTCDLQHDMYMHTCDLQHDMYVHTCDLQSTMVSTDDQVSTPKSFCSL